MAEVYVDETPAALTEAAALLTGGAPEEPPFKRSKSAEEIAPLGSVAPSLATPGLTAPGIAPLPTPGLAGIAPLPTPGLVGIAPLSTAETAGFAPPQHAQMAGFAPLPTVETAGIAPLPTPLPTPGLGGFAPPQPAQTAGFAPPQPAQTAGFAPLPTAETAGIAPLRAAGPAGTATPASSMPAGQPRNTDESQNPFDFLRQNGINISLNFNFGNMPPRA